MEKVLQKLARQILAYDEASLSSMWEQYARAVQEFEPTKRWEEAVLVLGIIQAVRWKNQLFNHHWKQWSAPGDADGRGTKEYAPPKASDAGEGGGEDKRGKLLRFRPRKDEEPV